MVWSGSCFGNLVLTGISGCLLAHGYAVNITHVANGDIFHRLIDLKVARQELVRLFREQLAPLDPPQPTCQMSEQSSNRIW